MIDSLAQLRHARTTTLVDRFVARVAAEKLPGIKDFGLSVYHRGPTIIGFDAWDIESGPPPVLKDERTQVSYRRVPARERRRSMEPGDHERLERSVGRRATYLDADARWDRNYPDWRGGHALA